MIALPTLPSLPRWAWWLIGVAVALLAIWALRADAYSDGRRAERSAWEQRIERAKAAQAARERTADRNLQDQRARDDGAAQQRQQEIDNATRDIPDQAPSARQRSRACIELRKAAAASGSPAPC